MKIGKPHTSEGRDAGAIYRQMLMDKRESVLSGLGLKFDMLARMGRLAEEDQAQVSHDEFVSLKLNSLDYVRLKLIDEALDRMEAGDYGSCLSCETPIPSKRLEAVPWTRYCIQCQEMVGNLEDESAISSRTTSPPG